MRQSAVSSEFPGYGWASLATVDCVLCAMRATHMSNGMTPFCSGLLDLQDASRTGTHFSSKHLALQ